MRYDQWYNEHQLKHQKILSKLKGKSIDEIIEYFDYENMKVNEKEFCPLYEQNKKCHGIEELNCYFCACPCFIYSDDGLEQYGGKTIYSKCTIHAKDGAIFTIDNAHHQDCTHCTLPHKKSYVKRKLLRVE